MRQTTVNVRVDANVKQNFEEFCETVGMNISTAINLFIKTVLAQRKIPFEIAVPDDPFYKGANWRHIQRAIAEWDDPSKPKIIKTMAELEAMANE